MKLISWNVNGLRACLQKGFLDFFNEMNADFFCLQETKLQEGQVKLDLPGYEQYWCYAQKKGYSGTAIFTKHTPLSVSYGLGIPELDTEGRMITLEYPEFYLVTCYTPNAQRELARIDHRMRWDDAFRHYIAGLDAKKPVMLCGDLNVAHKEIDLKNPGSNRGNAGFSDQERDSFSKTLSLGFTDTFRHLNPDVTGAYTWWSYMFKAREKNAGWRIDYFLVSDRLKESIYRTPIYADVLGSDHCPVGLEIDLPCNGSIWSGESMGKGALLFPVGKEKSPAPAKSGISPAGKTILSYILAVAVTTGFLFGGFQLLPKQPLSQQNPTISENNPTSTTPTKAPAQSFVSLEHYVDVYPYYLEPTYTKITDANIGLGDGKNGLLDMEEGKTYRLGDVFPRIPSGSNQPVNFWFRIALTDSALSLYDNSWDIYCSTTSANTDIFICPYYDMEAAHIVAGWFVFGYSSEPALNITVRQTQTEKLIRYVRVFPLLNYDQANVYATYQLIDHVASHPQLQEELPKITISSYYPSLAYVLLTEKYPVLQILNTRADVISEGLRYLQRIDPPVDPPEVTPDDTILYGLTDDMIIQDTNFGAQLLCIVNLLSLDTFQQRMDSAQLEEYQRLSEKIIATLENPQQ